MQIINPTKIKELEDQIDTAGLEQSMNYTLADAIREGSSVTGQKYGDWTDQSGQNVCAMSAAVIALKARHII